VRLIDPADHVQEMLELEFLASEPYARFVFDTEIEAKEIAKFLFESNVGENVAPYVSLAVDDATTVLGLVTFLDAAELKTARMAAAIALVRGRKVGAVSATRDRMLLAAEILMDVEPHELYLSRIAVTAAARGRGVGCWLLEQYETDARRRSKTRLVLEVAPEHAAALSLYERCGFETLRDRETSDPGTGRRLAYRHMAKTLA